MISKNTDINDVPIHMDTKFENLDISDKIKSTLREMKMIDMTPIQAKCIPHLLEGKDLLGAAKTGSGKTLAFLVPLINKIIKKGIKHDHGTMAIIMSPTRELSIQTFNVLERLIDGTNVRAGLVIGGKSGQEEARYLAQGITVLVATPGRLLDHLNNTKSFVVKNLNTLVIDEADRLMNVGFLEDMRAITNKLPKDRQTVLFSATLDVNSGKLKNKMKKMKDNDDKLKKLSAEEKILTLACFSLRADRICIDVSSDSVSSTVSQLTQNYVVCDAEDRFRLLCTLLKNNKGKKIMIFMSTCLEVKYYHTLLNIIKPNILGDAPLIALQGKQKQGKREENYDKFKDQNHAVLLCTDVAARGLDVHNVDMVVQFDPPEDHNEYIHRVGRTARAGKEGQAIIFLRSHEEQFISMLHKEKIPVLGLKVEKINILPIQDSLEDILNKYSAVFKTAKEAFKTVVSAYTKNPMKCFDVNQLDLGALAKNFGLASAPPVTIHSSKPISNKKEKKRQIGMNSDDDNYYIPSKCSKNE